MVDGQLCHVGYNEKCYGCGACVGACDVNAITMEKDEEGFIYPVIDEERCIKCKKCVSVCPLYSLSFEPQRYDECYAFSADDEIRKVSSSGGIFSCIAEEILAGKGHVCAAAFSDDYLNVEHIIIQNMQVLDKVRKSKYIQSDTVKCFPLIKAILENENDVLFVGCPCQVAGLRTFLGKKYQNLFTVDLMCHGIPSPLAWKMFLEEVNGESGIQQADFRYRDNDFAWGSRLMVKYKDGTQYISQGNDAAYLYGFVNDIINRKSCGQCPFPYFRRQGDITIGDFWGIEKIDGSLSDGKGCSAVFVNSENGKKLIEKVANRTDVNLNRIVYKNLQNCNPVMVRNFQSHIGRERFFDSLMKDGFGQALRNAQEIKYDLGITGNWYIADYGAALSGYALNTYIRSLGYTVLMIDIPEFQFVGRDSYRDDFSPARRFVRMNCSVSQRYQNETELIELNDLCKGFILGADQIWNPQKNQYKEEVAFYLFNYVSSTKKMIAYGTRFGANLLDGNNEDKGTFGYLLNRFSEVSVCEKEGVEAVKELFGVDAALVLEPVFLLGKDEYIKHIRFSTIDKNKIPDNFIFLYLLQPTKENIEYAKKVANVLGLKIVAVPNLDSSYVEYIGRTSQDMLYFEKVEVADWIYIINKAAYVITDCYYALCFSLIFHKQFFALSSGDEGSRILSMAEIEELSERIFVKLNENNCAEVLQRPIDYEFIDRYLERKIEESKKWLTHALQGIQSEKKRGDIYDIVRCMMLRKQEEEKVCLDRIKETFTLELRHMKKQIISNRYFIVKLFLEKILTGKKVAIRCAGVHTKELLKVITDKSVIKCIWDYKVSDEKFCEYPCISEKEDLKKYEIDTILISSYKYRHEIKSELFDLSNEYEVIDLYEALENEGITFDSEFYWF